MISKITMKDVASYRDETSLATDKRVNLIYGLNGTGKSTLSVYLYNSEDDAYKECAIDGMSDSDEILVYNQKFIKDNFYETEDIPGIFTLSKGNKEAKELIDGANREIKKLVTKKINLSTEKGESSTKHQKEIDSFKNEVWKIRTEHAGGNSVLDFCFSGLKGSKDILFKFFVGIEKSEDALPYSVEELKDEAAELKEDVVKEREIKDVHFMLEAIEGSPLLTKAIVGKKDSAVADLIERLQNAAWVEEGLDYIHIESENTQCPFCQQRTITKELYKQISDFFDESYKKDKEELENLLGKYKAEAQRITDEMEVTKENRFMNPMNADIDLCISEFRTAILENISQLEKKIKNSGMSVTLASTKGYEERINEIISRANLKIREFNEKVEHIQDARDSIKEKFWQLMREEYDSVVTLYHDAEKRQTEILEEYEKRFDEIANEEKKQKKIIGENQKKTVNIDEAVENIRQNLIDIGITDFTIEKYSDDEALYRLKREHSEENVFDTLSEGEKMVISFLYFVEMCKGTTEPESAPTNKIVVIDDPISSLSHIYIFNIGRVIHNEFLRTDKYEQIFVLTHSLYFFYELTNIDHKKREETQALFRIVKNDSGSSIISMKYEEIQNDYQSYWHIIKDKNQPPALIANCMRNILEYFFNFVEKRDFGSIFDKKELKKTSFSAFNRYMNRESHSIGQNIFDIKEFNYESFKSAFKLVFEITGYTEHYKKMMR